MRISFSSSLFGLAGSLVLGFLDLQTSQAQNRFYTELEDWLSTTVRDLVVERDPTAALPMAAGAPTGDLQVAIERRGDHRQRLEPRGDLRHGQSGGSDSGAGPPHAHRAADDPRLGRIHQAQQHREVRRLLEDSRARRREEIAPGRIREALARARRDSGMNYWPGFVDALSTLILGFIFLVTVFAVVQFYLTQEVSGKDTALNRLNAQIAQLTELLSLEKTGTLSLEEQLNALLEPGDQRGRARPLQGPLRGHWQWRGRRAGQGRRAQRAARLGLVTARALAQVEVLNQQIAALRRQLSRAQIGAGRQREKGQGGAKPHRRSGATVERGAGPARAGAVALPFRLLRAAARHSRQSARYPYRGRPLRVPVGGVLRHRQATLDKPEGRAELDALASAARTREEDAGRDRLGAARRWAYRRTADLQPAGSRTTGSSPSGAISVVQYLISKSVSPQRLVAAGFGEFQPIDADKTEEAFSRNRRIELKLTRR